MSGILILIMLLGQIAPPQEYTAKPGDSVTVTVWGRETLSGTIIVDPNGNIIFPMPIGSVSVAGLNTSQISDIITKRLEEYMVNPTIFVSISPAEGFNVHVLGEVQAPNFIKVPYGTTVQEAITRAGGFTPLSDKKNILLIRKEDSGNADNITEMKLNLEKFMDEGDRSANPELKSDDVLIVNRLTKTERIKYVNVLGGVANPGVFDLEEPLPLIEVLALAGGTNDLAILNDLSILRLSNGSYLWENVDFESFITKQDASGNPTIQPGDVVFVPTEPKEKKPFSVNVIGQVIRPGAYQMQEGSRLFDALFQAGGFVDEAAIDRISIIHSQSSNLVEEKMNIREFLVSGDEKHNPVLEKGDNIFVPMLEVAKKIPAVQTAFFPSIRVSIIGEVVKPETYQISTKASLLDVLKIAGGPTSGANLKGVTLIRELPGEQQRQKVNLREVLTEGNFQLLPDLKEGDTIFIPLKTDSIWRSFVRLASDVSIISLAFLYITGRRW